MERPRTLTSRCLWLVPVTEAEVAFKREHGVDALETAFEAAQLDYLDLHRSSVVEPT